VECRQPISKTGDCVKLDDAGKHMRLTCSYDVEMITSTQ
jgi:hypothetical protein